MSSRNPETPATAPEPDWVSIVREKVGSLRYGVVQVTVHEGKVTQIERTERIRLDSPAAR